jgi:hypothetical protein
MVGGGLDVVDEDLPAYERGGRAAARTKLPGIGKEPVEPYSRGACGDDEPEVTVGRYT